MGKKIFKIFIVGFFKAVAVLLCMILAAVGGFFGTKKYYTVKNQRAKESEAKKMISGAKVDTVSRNLIFSYNPDKNTISNAVLEVFDTENEVMSYVTIPTSVEVTIPASMYRKLLAVNQ
jgi:glycerol uptake facilitator-like aquaporin